MMKTRLVPSFLWLALLLGGAPLGRAVDPVPARGITTRDIGKSSGQIPAADDSRIVGAVQRVITMLDLRALPVPAANDPKSSQLVSFYADTLTGGGLFVYVSNDTTPDDTGTVIRPNAVAVGSPGRWRRVLGEPNTRNIMDFGARPGDLFSASSFDNSPVLNAAISSLPNFDFTSVASPGAGGTGHLKTGTIYAPDPGGPNIGYCLGSTVYFTPGVSLIGSPANGGTKFAMLPGWAPSAGTEKFGFHWLATGSTGSNQFGGAGDSFDTRIENICIQTSFSGNNPGGSGVYFASANSSLVRNVKVQAAIRGLVVNSTGCLIENFTTPAGVIRGPALHTMGSGITIVQNLPEHTNIGNLNGNASGTFVTDPTDGQGDPYPAILIESSNTFATFLQTELSGLGLKIRNARAVFIGSHFGHIVTTGVKIVGDCNNVFVGNASGDSMTTYLQDVSQSGGSGPRSYTAPFGGLPYSQFVFVDQAFIQTALAARNFSLHPNYGTGDDLSFFGNGSAWAINRTGGTYGNTGNHAILTIDAYDQVITPRAFFAPRYRVAESNPDFTADLTVGADHRLHIYSNSNGQDLAMPTFDAGSTNLTLPSALTINGQTWSKGGYRSGDGSVGVTRAVTINGTTLDIRNGIIVGVSP